MEITYFIICEYKSMLGLVERMKEEGGIVGWVRLSINRVTCANV